MAVYTIADLHLSASSDHPMDVFGSRWQHYTQKIEKNWRAVVAPEDTVILPGDISWAMTLKEALADFQLLHSLPGKKLIGKGNHDFWWETAAKQQRFFDEHGLDSFSLLYNNAFVVEDFIVCGTRGWFLEKAQQVTVGEVDYDKILNRELARLKLSLNAAAELQKSHPDKEILVFLHFPPLWGDFICPEFLAVIREFGVKRCFFGHIHGSYNAPRVQSYEGLSLHLISSDYLNFIPFRIHRSAEL
ncbi:MAG: serine/threonine protein phosphatase [Ruminococcaceae bacterium]|nr:serine/threonine protein phosphatase [Oscillospiraceae bacterium]